uniref:Uncharacterized protein LOC104244085 isoform X2 n=1 Tax=Nicotiana sylvestris TaxID=4096 RepID=A0A1U7Y0G8_NICSY|nr:PREDICTED: uncharacterized protein LOC104244085 isoform X2 [Nicotiana sylvestris]
MGFIVLWFNPFITDTYFICGVQLDSTPLLFTLFTDFGHFIFFIKPISFLFLVLFPFSSLKVMLIHAFFILHFGFSFSMDTLFKIHMHPDLPDKIQKPKDGMKRIFLSSTKFYSILSGTEIILCVVVIQMHGLLDSELRTAHIKSDLWYRWFYAIVSRCYLMQAINLHIHVYLDEKKLIWASQNIVNPSPK